jgi:hypothetical protein
MAFITQHSCSLLVSGVHARMCQYAAPRVARVSRSHVKWLRVSDETFPNRSAHLGHLHWAMTAVRLNAHLVFHLARSVLASATPNQVALTFELLRSLLPQVTPWPIQPLAEQCLQLRRLAATHDRTPRALEQTSVVGTVRNGLLQRGVREQILAWRWELTALVGVGLLGW